MTMEKNSTGFYSVIVRTILAGISIVNVGLVVATFGLDYQIIQLTSLLFGLVASVFYYVETFTKHVIGRSFALALLFANSCAVAFLFDLTPAPVYVFLASFVPSIIIYNDKKIIRLVAIANVIAAIICVARGDGNIEMPYFPYVILLDIVLVYVIASAIKIKSSEKYFNRMRDLRKKLHIKKEAIMLKTTSFIEQSEKLQSSQVELEARISENGERVSHLQSVNKELDQIANAASRDLKAPLRVVGTHIANLSKRLNQLDQTDGLTDYLHYITDGAARMNAMVDDLLQYCNPSTKHKAQNICTQQVLEVIEANLVNLMLREDAHLIVQRDMPIISGHKTEILQLFQNLISNGIKFRKPGEMPICNVGFTRNQDEICFHVSDNGIGIPANRVQDVFGLFTRLHERGSYEGTGIGLALCRRIVLAAGGEIWAESTEGEGTTFFFTWPLVTKVETSSLAREKAAVS